MNRAALIDQIQQARETLLQSAPVDATDLSPTFISPGDHIGEPAKLPESPARKSSGASSQASIAESMGFKGDFRQWEQLMRVCLNNYPGTTGATMLLAQQSQRFGLQSNHRKSSGICFGFMWGMNNIRNAKDFRQNVQALNC